MRKSERRRYSDSGLPVDPKDWTRQDWQDLHEAMQTVIKRVSERHARRNDATSKPLPTADATVSGVQLPGATGGSVGVYEVRADD